MTTTLEFIFCGIAVVLAGILVILYIHLYEEIKAHADTIDELTKVKEELKKEKEAQMLEIQTRQFRIAEERKVQKLGVMVVLSPEEFSAWKKIPTEEIEQLIRNDMARQVANAIKPYIEIEMADFPDGYGNFRFMGQLRIAVREPKHIDFSEAFRIVGRDPEEAK